MGIFDEQVGLYRTFKATLQFRNWVVGGQPKDPKALREMLMRRAGAGAEELLRHDLIRLAQELDIEIQPDMPLEDLEKLTAAKATRTGNGFFFDEKGLYLGSYQIKAAFREVCNIAFGGERWGKTKKGAKGYLAERLFVEPEKIHLGRLEPDGISQKTGVITGQQGKRSIVTQFEYCDRPEISFDVRVDKDAKELLDAIPQLWVRMQDNGLGAMRSSGFGTFDLLRWEEKKPLRQVA